MTIFLMAGASTIEYQAHAATMIARQGLQCRAYVTSLLGVYFSLLQVMFFMKKDDFCFSCQGA